MLLYAKLITTLLLVVLPISILAHNGSQCERPSHPVHDVSAGANLLLIIGVPLDAILWLWALT